MHHILTSLSYEEETSVSNELELEIADSKKEGAKKSSKTKEAVHAKGHAQSKDPADSAGPSSEVAEADGNGEQKKVSPLHDGAKAGDFQLVLKLLEEGADPCVKDEGGYTAYARAGDKETRNVFRRFMAGHPDMWDWQAAGVPSPLTAEMEASQAAKQVITGLHHQSSVYPITT